MKCAPLFLFSGAWSNRVMPKCSKVHLPRLAALVAVCFLMLGAAGLHAQKIDLNGNNMSDVWEWVFGNGAFDPSADPDGDGLSNLKESLTGTDPSDPNSAPRISSMARSNSVFTVTMPSALGKQYQLQSSQEL